MPSRNVLKPDVADGYYHVYVRGGNKRQIFRKPEDYAVFLNLLKRYLSKEPVCDKNGVAYPHLYRELELLCFCLMPNHLHLLIYQNNTGAMQKLMRSVLTSYSRYFNRYYQRSGPLFESRYKASLILNQSYLEHISRYIHLNPPDWQHYSYSSLPYFNGHFRSEWLRPSKVLDMFRSRADYVEFMEDYQDHKQMLNEIKAELADS